MLLSVITFQVLATGIFSRYIMNSFSRVHKRFSIRNGFILKCCTSSKTTTRNEKILTAPYIDIDKINKSKNAQNFIRNTFNNANVLICGDGDFSFTKSFAVNAPFENLISTTLSSRNDLYSYFPQAESNIANLSSTLSSSPSSTSSVEYCIDATSLPSKWYSKFDVVLWNFPHINGKQNIKHNRKLLKDFLLSSKKCLTSIHNLDSPNLSHDRNTTPISSSSNNTSTDTDTNIFHHNYSKNNDIKTRTGDTATSSMYGLNGCIIISLCEGQSGMEAKTILDWSRSWKLPVQAAEAGLAVVDIRAFEDSLLIDGYTPQGHRGFGGGFNINASNTYILSPLPISTSTSPNTTTASDTDTYYHSVSDSAASTSAVAISEINLFSQTINKNNRDLTAIQPPIYVHEVHMYIPQTHPSNQFISNNVSHNNNTNMKKELLLSKVNNISNELKHIENQVRKMCLEISKKHSFSNKLWCADMVDVYIDPVTDCITVAHQIGYCSLTHALSRSYAESMAQIMEAELPVVMNYRPRKEKHIGQVSKGYPHFVANVLKNNINSQEYMDLMSQRYGDRTDEYDDIIYKYYATKSETDGVNNTNSNTTSTTSNSNSNSRIDLAKLLTGVLWRKRAGVIANSFI